jgi:hypothetical protein
MLTLKTMSHRVLITCCILHHCSVLTSCKKAAGACIAKCSPTTRMVVPNFYPQTLRTAIEEQLNKEERLKVFYRVKASLDSMKHPDVMHRHEIQTELKNRVDKLDAKYSDFEQLPGKYAPIDHKIAYTTEINRVRLLEIALRDTKEKNKEN